jgi:hypothetical protein
VGRPGVYLSTQFVAEILKPQGLLGGTFVLFERSSKIEIVSVNLIILIIIVN